MKQKFNVTGMTCSACSSNIEKNVRKLEGVVEANVNLLANTMNVEYDEKKVDINLISKTVSDVGYSASVVGDKQQVKPTSTTQDELKEMKHRLIYSLIFLIPLFYISMGHMMGAPLPSFFHGAENAMTFGLTQLLLVIPICIINEKYFRVGFKALWKRSPNMDSLIAVGSTAAVFYGIFALYHIGYGLGHQDVMMVKMYMMDLYFESAGMILTLITVGKYLETRSKGKTSQAISKLIDLTPLTALVDLDGERVEIPIEELKVNDIFYVLPGSSVAVDGIIIEGNSAIDESAITGESIPVDKTMGDKVIGATINASGFLKCQAMKVGQDTTLAQIVHLVEEASGSKAPIAKMADQVAGVFVPVVMVIALLATIVWLMLGYSFTFALSIGIAVLVISCPCALGLATPTAIMVATGLGAENGILIKSAESLETAHHVQAIILDKTGTITEGKPRVSDVLPTHSYTKEQLLRYAASAEMASEHPLGQAIIEYVNEQKIDLLEITSFNALVGEGLECVIQGKQVLAGNKKLMDHFKVNLSDFKTSADLLASKGKTPLYFAMDNQLMGLIAVADQIKQTSKEAIDHLQSMGLEVIMMTGDNHLTANAIKEQLNLNAVISEVLPQDKERVVREYQEKGLKVAMIGDGINDAPALMRADVGIAIGAGTDIAIESADIVLMKSDLMDAVNAIRLSKAVIVNIKQNLFWAFFYNVVGIPLAAGVLFVSFGLKLNPMFAAAAMSLSSVFVVTNALRLRWFKPIKAQNSNLKTIERKKEEEMKKVMMIEGMSCGHCSGRVEKALNALDGVSASVDLANKSASITLSKEVSDEVLKSAVKEAGYTVVSIV